jgi:hypothetical protein
MAYRMCGGYAGHTDVGGAPAPIGEVRIRTGGRATTDGAGIGIGGALALIGGVHTGDRVRMDGGGIDGGGSTCAGEKRPRPLMRAGP